MRPVFGDGPQPSRLMLVGERPGPQEYEQGRGFVGPSGEELWARLWRVARLQRRDFYVTNLVKTFSPALAPPTKAEIHQWAPMLRAEIAACQPAIIVTVGYHAARWFLPQFEDMAGDFFHGLAFGYAYAEPARNPKGHLLTCAFGEPWLGPHPLCAAETERVTGQATPVPPAFRGASALVLPMIHSAAALRQPERYQQQLTDDCCALRRVVKGQQGAHVEASVVPYESGLAGYLHNEALGLDTEGTVAHPEAISLSHYEDHAYLGEVFAAAPSPAVAPAVQSARALYIHNAKYDWQVLDTPTFGIDLTALAHDNRLHCTMELAYLLGQAQALKVLAYRLFGLRMQEYSDLVRPYDDTRVHQQLEATYEIIQDRVEEWRYLTGQIAKAQRACAAAVRRDRKRCHQDHRAGLHARLAARLVTRRHLKSYRRTSATLHERLVHHPFSGGPGPVAAARSRRALTSIGKILHGVADPDRSLRARWSKSALADLAPLPPPVTWKDVPAAERQPYARLDAVAHRRVGVALHAEVARTGMLSRIYQIDMRALPMLIRMEQIGMACDADRARELAVQFKTDYDAACDRIAAHAGRRINPNAWDTVAELLFNELGVTPTRLLKSGQYTTQDKYLKARRQEHGVVNDIIEARGIGKLLTSYAVKLPRLLRNGRYHADWRYTRVPTGRLAEPLIVLIPKHTHRGQLIRACFHATDGHQLVLCDLSQIEMRVMAHLAQDKVLLDWYRRGLDVHAMTAHELLGAPKAKEAQDESLHRLPSKTINFLIINAGSEYGLLDQLHEQGQLHWTLDEAREFRQEWFKLHRGVARYFEQQVATARQQGFVEDMFGRRRRLDGIWSTDDRIVRDTERQALCPIQASADAISKIWNDRIWTEIVRPMRARGQRYCEPWVRVHDETVLEVDTRSARQVAAHMLQLVPQRLCIPTTAERVIEGYWGQHKLEKLSH